MTTPEIIVAVAVGLIALVAYAAIVGDARYRQTTGYHHKGATENWSPTDDYTTDWFTDTELLPVAPAYAINTPGAGAVVVDTAPDWDALHTDTHQVLEHIWDDTPLDTFRKNMDAIQTWLQTDRAVIWFTDLDPTEQFNLAELRAALAGAE